MNEQAYQDGDIENGTAILTITPRADADPARPNVNPFDATCDGDFDYTDGSQRVERKDKYGRPEAKFGIPTLREGNCVIQLPTDRRVFAGDTFVADEVPDITWIIESATNPFSKDSYRKQNITFSQKLNVA